MAFFVVSATTVPVAPGSVEIDTEEIGDRARTFDGTLRETIRNRVLKYRGSTPPLARATATSVYNALASSSQPISCVGDMLSSSTTARNLFTRVVSRSVVQAGTTMAVVIEFEAEQSS